MRIHLLLNKFEMKKCLFAISIVLTTAGCDNKSTGPASEQTVNHVAGANLYSEMAGVYSDTLPCADCPGIVTDLTLKPDTTFELQERRLVYEGRSVKSESYTGVFSFTDDFKKMKLTSTNGGGHTRIFEVGKNFLLATDIANSGIGNSDLTLDFQEKIVGRIGEDYIMHKTAAFTKFPVQVFSYMPGNNIHINKAYLDGASDAEKAIVLYYAQQYSSGCNDNGCSLQMALNLSNSDAGSLLKKWMPAAEISGDLNANHTRVQLQLALLFFIQNGNKIQVNYNLVDQEKLMSSAIDEFEVKEAEVVLSRKGELRMRNRSNVANGQKNTEHAMPKHPAQKK